MTTAPHCPFCRAKLDACMEPGGSASRPDEGDYSLCIYCGGGLVFDADGGLRAPTVVEAAEMQADADFQRANRLLMQLKRVGHG